jgi:hypothetical protein
MKHLYIKNLNTEGENLMKDTLNKLRALLNMKSHLLEQAIRDRQVATDLVVALRDDLVHAVSLIQRKDREIDRLNEELLRERMKEWEAIDKDEEWLAEYLAAHPTDEETIKVKDMTKETTNA